RVDFLPAADKAHTRTPIAVTRHQFEKEQRFGGRSLEFFLTLILVPSTLCLIEYDYVLFRCLLLWSVKILLQEVIDVLNSDTHISPNLIQSAPLISERTTSMFVTC